MSSTRSRPSTCRSDGDIQLAITEKSLTVLRGQASTKGPSVAPTRPISPSTKPGSQGRTVPPPKSSSTTTPPCCPARSKGRASHSSAPKLDDPRLLAAANVAIPTCSVITATTTRRQRNEGSNDQRIGMGLRRGGSKGLGP